MRRLITIALGLFSLLWLAGCAAAAPEPSAQPDPAPSSEAAGSALPRGTAGPTAATATATPAALAVVYFLDGYG